MKETNIKYLSFWEKAGLWITGVSLSAALGTAIWASIYFW